jgi:hypothetical protein
LANVQKWDLSLARLRKKRDSKSPQGDDEEGIEE